MILKTNYYVMRSAGAAAAEAEIERLTKRRDRFRTNGANLRSYLTVAIQARGQKRMEGFTSTLIVRRNPPSVQIADAQQLPEEFIREVKSYEPAKAAIADSFRAGKAVPGCTFESSFRLERA